MNLRPASLRFVEPNSDALGDAALELVRGGIQELLLVPWNDTARGIANRVSERFPEVRVVASALEGDAVKGNIPVVRTDQAEAAVVTDCDVVDAVLIQFMDRLDVRVVAPRTPGYFRKRPLFLISIPKSGTHLLYKLVEIMGYERGIFAGDEVRPGAWYCLEYSNSHTLARDFFVDSVRRSPFGNRHHPFATSPALFMYRNPLDILVSEANYYHRDGKTAFAGYLSGLSFERRVERLLDDPWLLGSLRDRISGFLPWLEFANVVPVSFEELIGTEGGGSRDEQLRLIWSLQLKLHVPGDPADFAAGVFDRSSQTFYQGRIGAYRDLLGPDLMRRFRELNQDFIQTLGYSSNGSDEYRSSRAAEFRRRPLRVSSVNRDEWPIALEYDFLACNLVRFDGWIYAVPQATGPDFDLRQQPERCLAMLPRERSLATLKHRLLIQSLLWGGSPALMVSDLCARLSGGAPGRRGLRDLLGMAMRGLVRLAAWVLRGGRGG